MRNKKVLIFIAAVLAMLFWGYSFVWYKIAYLYYKPFTVVFLRLIFSIIFLTLFIKVTGRAERIARKDLFSIMIMALCQPFGYFLGESLGMSYVSSTTGAIIIATIPLFTPLVAQRFLKEKIHISLILGLVISFAGVYMIVKGDYTGTNSIQGIFLMFFAVFAAVSYGVFLKKMSHKYSAFTIIKYQNIFGAFYFLPLFLIWDLKHFLQTEHHLAGISVILQMALFGSTLAFVFITFVIRNLGMSKTNIFINLIPVFTAVISFFVLKESFPLLKIVGILIVITGLMLSQIKNIRNFTSSKSRIN